MACIASRRPDGPVVCFDEMGPIQLIPHRGADWARTGRPERLRATYNRRDGTRYLFGVYDLHADHLFGRLRARKSARDVLGFLQTIRMRYRDEQRIYLGDGQPLHPLDHRHARLGGRQQHRAGPDPDLRQLPQPHRVSHFWAIGEFVIKNADYADRDTLAKAMANYIHLRNRTRGGGPIAQSVA